MSLSPALCRSVLSLSLLLPLAAPAAFAADQPCKNPAGTAIPGGTDQGHEAGTDNATCAPDATAVGHENNASAAGSTALGFQNEAFAVDSTAVGRGNITRALSSVAMGYNNEVEATAAYGTAVGRFNTVSGDRGVAMGSNNTVTGASGIALGRDSQASATEALAVGLNAQATGIGSVAIGSWSVANRGNAVSFGDATVQRQLINISAGTASTDAVNLGQLFPVMSALGGGASYAGGVFTAPSFSIQGSNYGSVAAAFSAVDARLTALGSGSGGSGNAVQYDGPARDSVTLGGSGGTRIQNVATGIAPTDAVNVGQMEEQFNQNNAQVRAGLMKYYEASQDYADAGDARTLAASKAYTDQKFAAWNDDFTQRMDVRLAKTDRRIDRIGAMGSAMTHMAVNAANGGSTGGRVAVGIGGQGSQGAISIGYGKRIGTRASFSFGGGYSGGETTAGAGFGFDL